MTDDTYRSITETESLCFLILGFRRKQQNYSIAGWEICYSYNNMITKKIAYWSSNERCCLTDLIHELFWCSIHKTPIVTYQTRDMPALRTRLLVNGISSLDFRKLRCFCLQQFIEGYFFFPEQIGNFSLESLAESMKIRTADVISAELLREMFVRIQPLLPTEVV